MAYTALPTITNRPLTTVDWQLWADNFRHFAQIFEAAGPDELVIGSNDAVFETIEEFNGLLTAGGNYLVEIDPPATDSVLYRNSAGQYEWADEYLLQQLYSWAIYDSVL